MCSFHSINAEALERSVRKLLNHQIKNVTDLGRIWINWKMHRLGKGS